MPNGSAPAPEALLNPTTKPAYGAAAAARPAPSPAAGAVAERGHARAAGPSPPSPCGLSAKSLGPCKSLRRDSTPPPALPRRSGFLFLPVAPVPISKGPPKTSGALPKGPRDLARLSGLPKSPPKGFRGLPGVFTQPQVSKRTSQSLQRLQMPAEAHRGFNPALRLPRPSWRLAKAPRGTQRHFTQPPVSQAHPGGSQRLPEAHRGILSSLRPSQGQPEVLEGSQGIQESPRGSRGPEAGPRASQRLLGGGLRASLGPSRVLLVSGAFRKSPGHPQAIQGARQRLHDPADPGQPPQNPKNLGAGALPQPKCAPGKRPEQGFPGPLRDIMGNRPQIPASATLPGKRPRRRLQRP